MQVETYKETLFLDLVEWIGANQLTTILILAIIAVCAFFWPVFFQKKHK